MTIYRAVMSVELAGTMDVLTLVSFCINNVAKSMDY